MGSGAPARRRRWRRGGRHDRRGAFGAGAAAMMQVVTIGAGQAPELKLAAAGIARVTGTGSEAARAARAVARAGAIPLAAHERFRRACESLAPEVALPTATGGADLTPAVTIALSDLVKRLGAARLSGAAAWRRERALRRGRAALRAAEAAIAAHLPDRPACADRRATRAIARFVSALAEAPGFSRMM